MRRMINFPLCATLAALSHSSALAEPADNFTGIVPAVSAATVAPWISQPELFQARLSLTNLNKIKGDFGENLVSAHLKQRNGWQQVSPGFGIHGPDHVTMKFDRQGLPRDVFFWDVKYNTSRPGLGQDTDARIRKWAFDLATQNRQAGVADLKKAPQHLLATRRMDIETPGGRLAVAWKDNAGVIWLDATPARAADVRTHLRRVAESLDATSRGDIRIRRRFIEIAPTADGLRLGFSTPMVIRWDQHTVRSSLVASIRDAIDLPISFSDRAALAASLADEVVQIKDLGVLRQPGPFSWARRAGTGGVAGAGLDVIFRLAEAAINGRSPHWGEVARGATVGGTSLTAAIFVEDRVAALSQRFAFSVAGGASPATRIALSHVTGGALGAAVVIPLYAYGGWALGLHDITTANRGAAAGGIGLVGGFAVNAALTGLVGTFGTASTGTAIGSLSGAAANSATLAWLGGGSLAAGGGGAAVGTIVLSGGTAVVVVALYGGVMYYNHWKDAQNHHADCIARIEGLKDHFERSQLAKE